MIKLVILVDRKYKGESERERREGKDRREGGREGERKEGKMKMKCVKYEKKGIKEGGKEGREEDGKQKSRERKRKQSKWLNKFPKNLNTNEKRD